MSTEESQSGSYGEEPPSLPHQHFGSRFRVLMLPRLSPIEIVVP